MALAMCSHEVMLASSPDSQAHFRKIHHRLRDVASALALATARVGYLRLDIFFTVSAVLQTSLAIMR